MDSREVRVYLAGAAGAALIFVVLFTLVDAQGVLDALAVADLSLVAGTFAVALLWLGAWSLMLRTVLASLDIDISPAKAFLVYVGAVFANNTTPFGQAGGEPIAALFISKVSDARYETGLVSIASVDVINVVPSIALILIGAGSYTTTAALGSRLETAVGSAVALIGGIVIVMGLIWRHHQMIVERLPGLLAPRIGHLDRFNAATVEANIAGRLERFFENIERVATDRWRLILIVALSLLGWLFQTAALLLAFAGVGYGVSPWTLLFVIPLANLAGVTPLPGGLGGIEAAFVALLVPTTGVAASAVTAAVLIFRAAIYWMPVVVGGISATAFGLRGIE